MKNVWKVIVLSGAMAWSACGGSSNECGTDSDCKGDRVCEADACVSPDDSGDGSESASSSGDSTDSSSSGSSQETSQETSSNSCCLNGSYYACPDADSADTCFLDFDPSGCSRDATMDASCDDGVSSDGDQGSGSGSDGSGAGDDDTAQSAGEEIGGECEYDEDCASEICMYRSGARFGYCSKTCESFADCPSFWDCTEVGDAAGKYCVQN